MEDIGGIGSRTEHVEGAGDLPDGHTAAISGGCDALERAVVRTSTTARPPEPQRLSDVLE